jgi:hypothetical protein
VAVVDADIGWEVAMATDRAVDAVRIPLNHGKVALIDAEDLPRVAPYRWHASYDGRSDRWYAVRGERLGTGEGARVRTVRMHRAILDAPPGMEVRHGNGDGLDNRRANLRLMTRTQRNAQRGMFRTNTSGYRGVSWFAPLGRWRAKLRYGGTQLHLGYHATAEAAARAYDAKAAELYGVQAYRNFPDGADNES